MLKLYSWNVNGIRASAEKGLLDWIASEQPDILCLQETKAAPEQLVDELRNVKGYRAYFASAQKRGYSGTAVYTRIEPDKVGFLGDERFDDEGRVLCLEFPAFTLLNCYFPNSQEAGARLDYKLAFCDAILKRCKKEVKKGRHVVLCGDYNIAHKPIDLAHPKENEGNPGYLPEERAWMDAFVKAGFVDSFRLFDDRPGQYSWWSYRMKAREKNVGWRIDLFCVDKAFVPAVKGARIHPEVMGSDHCPVSVELDV